MRSLAGMADTLRTDLDAPDDVHWDLEPLVGGDGVAGVERLLDQADARAAALAETRGHVAELDAAGLAAFMDGLAGLEEDLTRADSYAGLRFATDTGDQSRGALVAKVEERATAIRTQLLFFELEWAALDDARAEALRLRRPHLLTEPEERIAAEKDLTAIAAWQRLFEEQDAAIEVTLDGERRGLEHGLSLLAHPDRSVRQAAAQAVTEGLAPGLRTRAFILNTILLEKATDDRLRHYDHWLASRNLVNQASDASVAALIDAVKSRYDLPQRWYRIKAGLLGLDRLADYDRSCSVASEHRPRT